MTCLLFKGLLFKGLLFKGLLFKGLSSKTPTKEIKIDINSSRTLGFISDGKAQAYWHY